MAIFSLGFSQNLKPIAEKIKNSHAAKKTFVRHSLFTVDPSSQKQTAYKAAADDITVLKLNSSELQRINSERPETLEMSFPFEGKDITDNTSTSWKYKLSKTDGTVVESGVTTNKTLNFANLTSGTYYNVSVGTSCSGPQAYAYEQLILTDANWCSGVQFTDPGGSNANYKDIQIITKTFYPANASDKLKLTFTEFDTEAGFDFVNVYDGPSTGSPRFSNGTQLSGTTIPGPFQSTHSTGAITVRFISDAGETGTGWNSTFQCISTLGTDEASAANSVVISQSSVKGIFNITSKDKILSYKVYDASGKMVKENKISAVEEKLDLSTFPRGTYVVNITTSKETITKKVIK